MTKTTKLAIYGFMFVLGLSTRYLYKVQKASSVSFPDLSHKVEQNVKKVLLTVDKPWFTLNRKGQDFDLKLQRDNIIRNIREKSVQAGIDPLKALEIAYCESGFDPKAKNKNSSAKGIYQFVDKTWNEYCAGDPYMPWDNINCFVQLYPKHKSWWVCQGK